MKVCALVANFTHSVIITNNFAKNDFKYSKVVFITQKSQKEKLTVITNNYFKKCSIDFVEWGDENASYGYDSNIIFAIYGSDSFIFKVNEYLKMLNLSNIIIDLYEITLLKCSIEEIVKSHDYYLDSTGLKTKR